MAETATGGLRQKRPQSPGKKARAPHLDPFVLTRCAYLRSWAHRHATSRTCQHQALINQPVIYSKLGVRDRAAAVATAYKRGLLG
jgi:hypothetical protein